MSPQTSRRALKRPATSSPDREPTIPPYCYLTRGRKPDRCHVWNVSPDDIRLRSGDKVSVVIVSGSFSCAGAYVLRAMHDIMLPGSWCAMQALGRDVRLEDAKPSSRQTRSAAAWDEAVQQTVLLRTCASKGVDCAAFLERCCNTAASSDEELRLGEATRDLYEASVKHMLERGYDVMHHYALFHRALKLHYSASRARAADPPDPGEFLNIEGCCLDLSAKEHSTCHGLDLRGRDRGSFSRWSLARDCADFCCLDKANEEKGEDEEEEREEEQEEIGEDLHRGERDANAFDCVKTDCASPAKQNRSVHGADATAACRELYCEFNNLRGTLTDGTQAFPYVFSLRAGGKVTFDDLIEYCVNRNAGSRGPLPARASWGAVNPVLLMEDSADPVTKKVTRRYAVTSRGYLSAFVPPASPCYNEVFLPQRPVSRLNLDLDLKCCRECSARYSASATAQTKVKIAEVLVASLTAALVEALLVLAKVKKSELEETIDLGDLRATLGKIGVYQRDVKAAEREDESVPGSKLSYRLLWYLPAELCGVGIQTYAPLLRELETASTAYALLSYPADAASCSICQFRGNRVGHGSSSREVSGSSARLRFRGRDSSRRSAVDRGPYCLRKCVRLPNCRKRDSVFEYVGTFNGPEDVEDPLLETPSSLAVGLSSNPMSTDVTFLGGRFARVLEALSLGTVTFSGDSSLSHGKALLPDSARVDSEALRLADLWGVSVTVSKSGSGLTCVRANERSETYPCPVHKRIHSKSMLCALVFASHTSAKCFVT